jgi:ATP synthase protein I
MTRIPPDDQEDAQDEVSPLTAEQVRELRKIQPLLSVWRVVAVQTLLGLLVVGVAWHVSGRGAAVSAAYGALTVVVPAALFARGLTSRAALSSMGAAVFGFFVWEFVKIGITVAMLAAAPHMVSELSWPALLVGLVVTMKVYWVALGMQRVFYPVRQT